VRGALEQLELTGDASDLHLARPMARGIADPDAAVCSMLPTVVGADKETETSTTREDESDGRVYRTGPRQSVG
jgi:hypothetical protein